MRRVHTQKPENTGFIQLSYVAACDLLSQCHDPRPATESSGLCQGWEVSHMQRHSCCCFCGVTSFSRCLRKAQVAGE